MYEPCYTSSQGLVGFRCRVGACTRVVRSYKGIMMHCKRKHGLTEQMKLFDAVKETKDEETKTAELEPIREQRTESPTTAHFDRGIFAIRTTED